MISNEFIGGVLAETPATLNDTWGYESLIKTGNTLNKADVGGKSLHLIRVHKRRYKKLKRFIPLVLTAFVVSTTACAQTMAIQPQVRFKRVFCWGNLTDEDTARKFAEVGVTDIRVSSNEQLALARKYGMTAYCSSFAPRGLMGWNLSKSLFFLSILPS